MKLPVTILSESERDTYMENSGIHGSELTEVPVPDVDVYDAKIKFLIERFKIFGKNDVDEDSSYYIDDYANPSCVPCVEISDISILSSRLVSEIHRAVLEMGSPYRVHLCTPWGIIDEELNLIVECDRIYLFSTCDEWQQQLDLDNPYFTYE